MDSFLDLMTCMLGILILMILLTGIDASQIRVLVPTPMEHTSEHRPIFIECRDNELFLVPIEELQKLASAAINEISKKSSTNTAEMLVRMRDAKVQTDAYRVDLNFTLLGQIAIQPVKGATGYRLVDIANETSEDWFGKILMGIKKDKEMLCFIVRDDSFDVFKRARALAWNQKVEVSYELIDANDPIKTGLGGSIPMAQ